MGRHQFFPRRNTCLWAAGGSSVRSWEGNGSGRARDELCPRYGGAQGTEIRSNVKTKYYPVSASVSGLTCRWKPLKKSPFYKETDLYEGKGFLSRNDAAGFISSIGDSLTLAVLDTAVTKKAAPLLYNLAELQSDCTKLFHIGRIRPWRLPSSCMRKN